MTAARRYSRGNSNLLNHSVIDSVIAATRRWQCYWEATSISNSHLWCSKNFLTLGASSTFTYLCGTSPSLVSLSLRVVQRFFRPPPARTCRWREVWVWTRRRVIPRCPVPKRNVVRIARHGIIACFKNDVQRQLTDVLVWIARIPFQWK